MSPPDFPPKRMGVFSGVTTPSKKGGANLAEELATWRKALGEAVTKSETARQASLEVGIREAATASLHFMNRMGWDPDEGMNRMFSESHDSPEAWAKALKPPLQDDSRKGYLAWWLDAQKRILSEAEAALKVAPEPATKRFTASVEALVMESFAACVVALPGVGKPWKTILAST